MFFSSKVGSTASSVFAPRRSRTNTISRQQAVEADVIASQREAVGRWEETSDDDAVQSRSITILRVLGLGLSVILIGLFLYVAIRQLLFPFEIEWYEGVMLDHALRVIRGLPIYSMPSLEFAPALYQPLYYYAAALFLKIFGLTYSAGRILSVASTIGSAVLLGAAAHGFRKRRSDGLLAAGLFLGAFEAVGYTYSLCRVDAFMLVLLLSSVVILLRSRSALSLVVSMLLLGAAYLTKQEILFYLPVLPLWLFLSDRRKGLLAAGLLIAIIGAATLYLQLSTDGWYGHIAYYIPSVKSQSFGWLRTISAVPYYFGRYWGAAIVGIAFFLLTYRQRNDEGDSAGLTSRVAPMLNFLRTPLGLAMLCFSVALVQAAMHRGDQMSATNVLVPFAAFSSLALIAALAYTTNRQTALLIYLSILIESATLLYNPAYEPMILPSASDRNEGTALVAKLASMKGRIYMAHHGFLSAMAGKNMSAHSQTLLDFYIPNDWVSRKLEQEEKRLIASGAFSHIIQDESSVAVVRHFPGYVRVENLDAHFGSRIGSTLSYPRFVDLPAATQP